MSLPLFFKSDICSSPFLRPKNLQKNFINPNQVNVNDPAASGVVRIAASYDMGWTT